MYNEIVLIDRIATQTGYATTYANEINLDVNTFDGVTRVYVGHLGIKMQHPEEFWRNGYEEFENQQVLLTHIHFLCARTSLTEVRTNIYNAYSTFSPVQDPNYSRLAFVESAIIAKGNSGIWMTETIGLIFPSIS